MNSEESSVKSPYNFLIFVCTNERAVNNPRGCCLHRGGEEILANFKEQIKFRKLKQFGVRATRSGCLDLCEDGPIVAVYGRKSNSDGIWYQKVKSSDVTEILDSHIVNRLPVEKLRKKF